MPSSPTMRERLENQRKQVAVLAQEIRRRVGPNLPDEIAVPLTAILTDAVAAVDLLNNAETWQDGSWLNPDPPMRYCLVPDPERGAP